MRGFRAGPVAVGIAISAAIAAPAGAEDAQYIAGLEPSARPAWAPVVTTPVYPANWYTRALTGIEPPYPESLRFLEDQGNWYQPFIRPGMTGPYDIRGWHPE